MANYPRSVITRALDLLLQPRSKPVETVSLELRVPVRTLERWRADALIGRGLDKGKQGDCVGGIADLSRVIGFPRAPSLLVTRALVNRGVMKIRSGDAEGAIADFDAAIGRRRVPVSELAPALYNRALARKSHLGDSEGAIRDFTAVINLPSVSTDLRAASLLNRAMMRERWGEVREATEDLKALFATPHLADDLVCSAAAFCRRAMQGLQRD